MSLFFEVETWLAQTLKGISFINTRLRLQVNICTRIHAPVSIYAHTHTTPH